MRFDIYIDLHFSVQAIVQQQIVRHTYTMWFHWMPLAIVIVANITCKMNFCVKNCPNTHFFRNCPAHRMLKIIANAISICIIFREFMRTVSQCTAKTISDDRTK